MEKDNFNWIKESIKYATINIGNEKYEKINLPKNLKNKIYNDSLSQSFIIWQLKKENLFGIKYANIEITINLDDNDKFLYAHHSEKGQINGGTIYLIKEKKEKKLIVSGNIELLNKLYSVLRIWYGDRLEYLSSDDAFN